MIKVNSKKETSLYFFKYTILFVFLSIFVFSWYFFTGKTFVYNGDGRNQYLPIYIYWSNYLRETLKNIFINHSFIIKQWDFSIGEGNDIISTLSYNIVGDPFCFLSFLVPAKYMYIYYSAMSLLRLYIAGISFSVLCFYTKKTDKTAVLAGTLSYVFFHYAIYNVTKHPHFLNSMIYFPLIIIGIEKIIKRESPLFYTLSVFISALTSFYFFYMTVILTIVYVITRLIYLYKNNLKTLLSFTLRYLLFGILGTCLAGIILFPTIYEVLHDSRQGMANNSLILYDINYYIELLNSFITTSTSISYDKWICLGFSTPVIISLYKLFIEKIDTEKFLKTLVLISFLFVVFPIFGLIINGFQYPSHRYCWGIALLYSYILVCKWESISIITSYPKKILLIFLVMMIFSISYTGLNNFVNLSLQLSILILLIITLKNLKKSLPYKGINYVIFIALFLSIFVNSIFVFSKYGRNFASRGTKKEELNIVLENETNKINRINSATSTSDSFFRYSGHNLTEDVSMVSGLSAIQHYISLTNPKIQEFRKEMEINQAGLLHRYQDYDDRSILESLSAVKYFYIPNEDSNPAPYGFTATEDKNIFINENVLPLSFTYNSYIPLETWKKLNPIEKQEVLLQSVVLDKNPSLKINSNPDILCKKIDSNLKLGNDIKKTENGLLVTKKNARAYISFEGIENSETYIRLTGFDFKNVNEYDLSKITNTHLSIRLKIKFFIKKIMNLQKTSEVNIIFSNSKNLQKKLEYKTKYYTWYANRHSFCINMGYEKTPSNMIEITFNNPGLYSLENLEVICLPLTKYESQIKKRSNLVLNDTKIATNKISGTVNLPNTEFLYFSIPYTNGWKAKVDGKPVVLHQANIMHMGIIIDKGFHKIELTYKTPMLLTGALISLISLIIIFIIAVKFKRNISFRLKSLRTQ